MKGILTDNRAQGKADKAVGLVIFLTILTLIGAVLVPVAIDAINSDDSVQITQDTTTTEDVNAELNTTLDSVDDTAGTATYTLETDSQSITNTIDEGTNATYAFDRGDVVVTVDTVNTGNATATYEYPNDFAYSSGASALWALLGLAMVLVLFLYTVRAALGY